MVEWLTVDDALQIHDDQIERYGGLHGLRDIGALEFCIARPRNLVIYGTPDIFELAACYSFGLVKNHCFIDGNKRTGFAAGVVFLLANGFLLPPSVSDAAQLVENVAAGLQGEVDMAEFFRAHSLLLSNS